MLALVLLLAPGLAMAGDSKLNEAQRTQIIRDFLAERPWVHCALPRGKAGVRIEEDGKLTPSAAEMKQRVEQIGPAAKAGERVKITAVRFVHHGIVFDINGGPVKRKKWTERVQVGVNGIDPHASQNQSDDSVYIESSGSSVLLVLKDESALSSDQIKERLAPVLDFKAMSRVEAFEKSLPPLLAAAVKNHKVLVGMDKEMVLVAVGRPARRLRETKDGRDLEEWIYGAPPQDVEFVRFLGDKVVSIEDMKVTGEKLERTESEVDEAGGTLDASAGKHERADAAASAAQADEERRGAPTLLRPGEKGTETSPADRDRAPAPAPQDPVPTGLPTGQVPGAPEGGGQAPAVPPGGPN
jgi:hypothetical protein